MIDFLNSEELLRNILHKLYNEGIYGEHDFYAELKRQFLSQSEIIYHEDDLTKYIEKIGKQLLEKCK